MLEFQPSMRHQRFIILALAFFVSGCAGLPLQVADVTFPLPFFQPDFSSLSATDEEADGVRLWFGLPEEGKLRYHERNVMFAVTSKGRGLRYAFDMERTEHFSPGRSDGSFVRRTETVILKSKGSIFDKIEMVSSGEVLEFFDGRYRSQAGRFEVLSMERSPVFPVGIVRVGDTWSYDEEMVLKLHSFWIKQKEPSVHQIRARSELKGFTSLAGRRVAVIYTQAEEKTAERLSVLFKEIRLNVSSQLEEIMYLDYKQGRVVQKVANTISRTMIPGTAISVEGKSQRISRLLEV